MADNKPTTPTTPTSPTGTAIPMGSKYHWWYDSKAAGVSNSPGTNMTGRSPPSYSILSQSPGAGGEDIATQYNKRRDSLKNMVHLSDFATP